MFQQQMARIGELIQALEGAADPAVQNAARELVQVLLDLHGAGLERLLERTYDVAGQEAIDALAQEKQVESLLLLHGLHPLGLEARVRQALDRVRPYLGSHGGDVELLDATPEGHVRLRLVGSCHGCPSSRMTLQYAIEEAIYEAAPDVTDLEVEGAVAEQPPVVLDGFIPVERLVDAAPPASSNGSAWVAVDDLDALPAGGTRIEEVAGRDVLFLRVNGALYAYDTTCACCSQPLGQPVLDDAVLACPACGHRYDVVRAGRSLEGASFHLEPYPLLVENGRAQVAVPAVPAG